MVELGNDILRKLQLTELAMLKEVDRICRKNNIKYSLDGGTLLGAIRHDGFIPWDDDADIVMLRSEYYKFYEACKNDLDRSRFFLQEFRTDEQYRWGYSKLRYNDTVFLRSGQEHGKWNQGVFIDIFVYDQVPDNYFFRSIHLLSCYTIRKILYSEVGKRSANGVLFRWWYKMLSYIPRQYMIEAIEWIACMSNKNRHELVRHMTYPYRKECKYGLPRECFDEYIEKDFEGYSFKVFKKYDLYLTRLYGDYMTLPPEDKRIVHPVSKIVLPDDI